MLKWSHAQSVTDAPGIGKMLRSWPSVLQAPEQLIKRSSFQIEGIEAMCFFIFRPESFAHHAPPKLETRQVGLDMPRPGLVKIKNRRQAPFPVLVSKEDIVLMQVLMAEIGLANIGKQIGAFFQDREKEIPQAFVPNELSRSVCECGEASGVIRDSAISGDFAKCREANGVHLSDGIANLVIRAGELLLTQMFAHLGPFLTGDISFDKVSPGHVPIGNIHGQNFRHWNVCLGCHETMQYRCAVEGTNNWGIPSGKFDNDLNRRLAQFDQQYNVIVMSVADFEINQLSS